MASASPAGDADSLAAAPGPDGEAGAAQLRVSEKTVSTYRLRILTKLNLSNTAELIRYAAAEGAVV